MDSLHFHRDGAKLGDVMEDPKSVDIGPKFIDMYTSIYSMRQDLDRLRKPVGSKENPARTCRDLHYGHPTFDDGRPCARAHSRDLFGTSLTTPIWTCCSTEAPAGVLCLGWYWIDPNLGMADDAVSVFCNMTGGGETCVYPDVHSREMPNIPWRREGDKNDWYSNLRGGFRVGASAQAHRRNHLRKHQSKVSKLWLFTFR